MENIAFTLFTLEVSKELRSRDIALEDKNIFSMDSTLEVSKDVKSRILKHELENILFIFVTREVSNLNKLISYLQLVAPNESNIYDISFPFPVRNLLPIFIEVMAFAPENIILNDVHWDVSKLDKSIPIGYFTF